MSKNFIVVIFQCELITFCKIKFVFSVKLLSIDFIKLYLFYCIYFIVRDYQNGKSVLSQYNFVCKHFRINTVLVVSFTGFTILLLVLEKLKNCILQFDNKTNLPIHWYM